MTQKKKSSIDFDCLAVTDVKVTVFPNLPGAAHVKGVAEVVLNDQFILRGLRILDGTTGLFVSYPVDPCCGSGSTLLAAQKMSRKSFGFEVDRNFFNAAKDKVLASFEPDMFQMLKYENAIMNPPFAGGKE